MHFLTSLFIVSFLACVIVAKQSTYRAAVVEYAPILTAEKPMDQLLENLRAYVNYIEEAATQGVQIIVFPEDGLTGWGVVFDEDVVDELSTEIPDPSQKISPCTTQNANYNKALVDLSCSARNNKIYVAANLIERETENKTIYHNANVIFDRNGRVIVRYRKINLFNEDVFHPGNETVTFKTDFGVTFGVLICFDIMFKNPGLNILKDPKVTDIVYSVAWFSELPFLQALSIQHGYVTSTGVNFLSAGMHAPSTANGGSAIYLAGGKIAEAYISGSNSSKMIIQDVPIIKERKSSSLNWVSSSETINQATADINSFHTYTENMSNYTFKGLDLNKRHISETICNEGTKFCCRFNITISKNPKSNPNYVYKMTAFHGSRLVSEKDTVGVRNCGIVACLNESYTSCGGRHEQPNGVTFDSIEIRGTFNAEDSHDQPATLNYDLKPATGYVFGSRKIGKEVEAVLRNVKKQRSLLTFGIQGRVFKNDNKPTGTIEV